jgi:hypothetical protein
MTSKTSASKTMHRRLLAAGLIAGISTVALAGTAQAASTEETVTAGSRQTVATQAVSASALPATFETGTTRRTSTVTITL